MLWARVCFFFFCCFFNAPFARSLRATAKEMVTLWAIFQMLQNVLASAGFRFVFELSLIHI